MGIQINGQTDIISATDGSLTVSGADLGSASASNLNISGIVTATEFSGNVTGNLVGNVTGNLTGNINSSGVSTFTDLRVGTAVTANSNGIQVGAGKSVRIFGSTSGYTDIISSAVAGNNSLTIPNINGSLSTIGRVAPVSANTLSEITFTGLPAGIKRAVLICNNLVSSLGSQPGVFLGSGGSYATTGYQSNRTSLAGAPANWYNETATSLFSGWIDFPGGPVNGTYTFTSAGSNIWVCQAMLLSASRQTNINGSVTLSGDLERIKFQSNQGNPFTGGTVGLIYEV